MITSISDRKSENNFRKKLSIDSFAEEKKRDCSEIKSGTLMSMIDKMRCKQGKGKMKLSLDGLKNVFKKKN